MRPCPSLAPQPKQRRKAPRPAPGGVIPQDRDIRPACLAHSEEEGRRNRAERLAVGHTYAKCHVVLTRKSEGQAPKSSTIPTLSKPTESPKPFQGHATALQSPASGSRRRRPCSISGPLALCVTPQQQTPRACDGKQHTSRSGSSRAPPSCRPTRRPRRLPKRPLLACPCESKGRSGEYGLGARTPPPKSG